MMNLTQKWVRLKSWVIHQAKGLEAKVVFIVDARDEMMPGKKKGINFEEECRVFLCCYK